jgi:hypothetical protein
MIGTFFGWHFIDCSAFGALYEITRSSGVADLGVARAALEYAEDWGAFVLFGAAAAFK